MPRPPALALVLTLLVAACGGAEDPEAAPQLPRDVAQPLAAQADAVARTIEAGDTCRAKQQAEELRRAVVRAIEQGRVPRPLRRELRSEATALVAEIECVPPAPPPPPPPPPAEDEEEEKEEEKDEGEGEGKGRGKGNGEGKGKGKGGEGEGGDDALPGAPLETVTEELSE